MIVVEIMEFVLIFANVVNHMIVIMEKITLKKVLLQD